MQDFDNPNNEDAWFVEERNNDAWVPVLYYGDRPTTKRSGNAPKRFRQDPKLVAPHDSGKSLAALQQLYGAVTETTE